MTLRRLARSAWAHAAILVASAAMAGSAFAAPPYATNVCAADRVSNLNCTANDVEVARLEVLNGVTTCLAGQTVTLDLRAFLHVNAQDRHDIGLFLARDGKYPVIPSANGGSADCAVFGIPKTPIPFADLDGNACGDFDRDGLPQGVETSLDLGLVTVTCKADADGYLDIPSVVSWHTGGTPTSCQSPPEAWVEPGSPSKCEAGISARIEVQVLGRIVVTKQTTPDAAPGNFSFTATGPGAAPTAFTLSDGQSQTIATGPLGPTEQVYTITEQQLAGWSSTAQIVCRTIDGDIAPFVTVDNATRTISARLTASFDQAFCTVSNVQQGSITVNKATLGGDGSFAFTGSQGIAPFSITTVGGSGQSIISGLDAGVYQIAETIPAGWDLSALNCVDPSGDSSVVLATATATINLAAGENVTCSYSDTRRASITVIKNTLGADGTFTFSGPPTAASPGGAFQITTVGGTGQLVLANLLPGSYDVTESVPVGWDLSGLSCVDPSGGTSTSPPTATIGLAAGENVTCTFTDTRRGAIVVRKQTLGGDAAFDFTGSQAFSITTTGGNGENTAAFASVPPGAYTITESALAGWNLTNLACVDPSGNSSVSLGTGTASIVLDAGETVICTYTNTQLATLTIIKHVVPHIAQPGTPNFSFNAVGLTPAAFVLADDGVNPNFITFNNLMPGGSYQVSETQVANFVLSSLSCTDQNDPNPANRSIVDVAGLFVTPNLQPGENLTCVFINARNDNGSIVVTKSTVGGGGSFDFTNSGGIVGSPTNPSAFTITTTAAAPINSQQLTGLAAGTYTIAEAPVPAGWDLGPIQCVVTVGSNTTFTPVGNAVTINLGITGGNVDAIACTFTNTQRGSITIVKQSTPQHPQDFAFTTTGGNGVPSSFALDDDADPTLPNTGAFSGLLSGTYTFTEQLLAGWRLTDIACNGGTSVTTTPATGAVTIDLHPGENVTCTFRNAQDGTITIGKVAVGGAGGESFAFQGPAPLAGSIGDGQSLSGGFAAGSYSVSELIPAGWDLTDIACVGGSVIISGATTNPTSGFEAGDTTVDITLTEGQAVSCTYTNTRRAAITIVKNTIGGDGTFGFSGNQSFGIQTSGGTGQNASALGSVAPGIYVVTETVPAGWALTALSCSNGSTVNMGSATASVSVAAGESVTCTFTNTRLGTIRIVKRLQADETATFNFTVPTALDPTGTFALAPTVQGVTASRTFVDVAPGMYVVTEAPIPAGWALIGLNCVDPTGDTMVDLGSARATINLGAGETVECTFDDTDLSRITISVVSIGGSDSFAFNASNLGANSFSLTTMASDEKASRDFANLMPGSFSVNGLGAPGWILNNVVCLAESGEEYWTIAEAQVDLTLPHGENIECIYYYVLAPVLPTVPIPTLSPWVYVLLSSVLLMIGWWRLRKYESRH